MKRNKASRLFMGGHYRAIADIINSMPDETLRRAMADHFATEFRKRFPAGFDPQTWATLTGGRVRGFDIRSGNFKEDAPQ